MSVSDGMNRPNENNSTDGICFTRQTGDAIIVNLNRWWVRNLIDAMYVFDRRPPASGVHDFRDISRSSPAIVEHGQRTAVEIVCGNTGEGKGGRTRGGR